MDLKSIHYIAFIGLCLTFAFVSCLNVTDYEEVPLEQVNVDKVFEKDDSLGINAKYFLHTVYGTMQEGHNRVGGDYLDAASDDAVSSFDGIAEVQRLATGAYSATNLAGGDMRWTQYYEAIRKANIFINNIEDVPVKETYNDGLSLIYAWKSEARFIRAWHYFNLLKRYGGVPIIGDEVPELGDDLKLPRDTFKESVDYIVSELDAIQDSLRTHPVPIPSANSHVVTKEAALALKARVLLYAASPLFNGENIEAQNPLTGYTDYSEDRWKRAADAARVVKDETPFSLMDDFGNIFTTVNSGPGNNSEVIFFRSLPQRSDVEETNGPVGAAEASDGRTSPTQNLVDAFPMSNGMPINEDGSGYDENDPYANRDPRLAHTVMYNGSRWLSADLETFDGGRNRPGGTSQQTKTSYYLRKFMGDFEEEDQYSNTSHDWVMFRYAEILLNFAEAQNEFAGPTAEVYDAVEAVRQRAGLNPYQLDAGLSKDEMREAIRNERRVELAFEEHRYWDIRRWKTAEEVFSEPLNGMRIIRKGSVLEYNRIPVLTTDFEEKRYLYPIPYNEVVGNPQMEQNPGW